MEPKERAQGTSPGDAALDAAFAEVLAAERAAGEAVEASRAQAQQRMSEAEAAVQDLAACAATRRRRWREGRAAAVARQISELQGQAEAAEDPVALDAQARARLVRAVEWLADELCGGAGKGR